MKRLASLWLPTLATDRIAHKRPDHSSPERGGGPHEVRWRGGSTWHGAGPGTPSTSLRLVPLPASGEEKEDFDCSCPRTPGFRPGAKWADLPAHQRPSMRELGRRTEAAEPAFRKPLPERAPLPPSPQPPPDAAPLVTAARTGNRLLVAAVNAAARAAGLSPGMPLTQARILVPGLDVRDQDAQGDAALLARLALHAARYWTPGAAVDGPDGLRLDLTGTAHLFGGEAEMCRRILGFCARLGLDARIAVAGSFGAAHALARFAPGPVTLLPGGAEAEALAPLPLAALRVEARALAAARRLGIATVGALFALPRAPLQRRFGRDLLLRLDQALGRAGEPVDPVVPRDPPAADLRFLEPIATPEAIAEAMGEGLRRLAAAMETAGCAARRILWTCHRVDGAAQHVWIGTARATRDAGHLARLFARKLEAIEPGFGIEAMRFVALRSEPLGPRPVAGALAGDTPPPDLVPLVDLLAGRLGAGRLYRIGAVESDVPERSYARLSPLDRPAAWPRWPRPVRLLPRPERVENVVALLPDLPPRRFTWRGRAFRVARADGPERIHGEWWRRSGEAEAVRDYFQVEDEDGTRFWIYRRGDGVDPRTGDLNWYLQGVFG
ncbi:MAG: DUF6504 family protein [Allosphingosinicella sp.]|uniref:DUF6504 family protein n=1 Tax=Allosphingosinicella sp. TaxID=2823234 RepID=UPI003944B8D6